MTKPPQRYHSNKGPRRALKLIVFVSMAGGTFIKELTGTAYEGYISGKQYTTVQNKQVKRATAMTGEEYMDCVKAAWKHFMRLSPFRRVAAHAMLVHDKSTVHCSACVVLGLRNMDLTSVVQPARSPDLMPLDYGIFGPAKNKLDAESPRDTRWEDRVALLKGILTARSPDATIAEFPLRLRACIASNGEHFGIALNELRKATSGQSE